MHFWDNEIGQPMRLSGVTVPPMDGERILTHLFEHSTDVSTQVYLAIRGMRRLANVAEKSIYKRSKRGDVVIDWKNAEGYQKAITGLFHLYSIRPKDLLFYSADQKIENRPCTLVNGRYGVQNQNTQTHRIQRFSMYGDDFEN